MGNRPLGKTMLPEKPETPREPGKEQRAPQPERSVGHPKTLIFWGQNDIFFTREGGEAYLHDLPDAEMHRLDSGHFAVEDSLDEIAKNIRRFYEEKVAASSTSKRKTA
jgi:pimeloyl-ACP methyl ester carboxylesterase